MLIIFFLLHVNVYFQLFKLKKQGLPLEARRTIFQALIVSRLTYAFASIAGFLSSGDIACLNSVFRKAVRRGITDNLCDISNFINNAQTRLFKQIANNSNHCLHHLLPEREVTGCNLRKRGHEFQGPIVLTSQKKFLIDFLYRHKYIGLSFCFSLPD
jgi:hypothetical protein